MIRRRIILALSIFVFLLLVVAVYNNFSGDDVFVGSPNNPSNEPNKVATIIRGSGLGDAPEGRQFYHPRYDKKTARLTGTYEAATWKKLSENSVLLTKPRIRLFRSDGSIIYIIADSGTIWADEVGRDFRPQRGILEGDVRVIIDRRKNADRRKNPADATTATRPADKTRAKDFVKIYTEDIEFNNEDLMLHADGHVTLLSAEVDVRGTGLTIQWNEEPSELRLLRIEQGESMTIYKAAEKLTFGRKSPGGTSEKPAPPDRKKPAAPKTAPSRRPAPSSPRAMIAPALLRWRQARIMPVMLDTKKTGRNVYEAIFEKDIRIYSGDQIMRDIDTLSLTFQWDQRARESIEREVQSEPVITRRSKAEAKDWLISQTPSLVLASLKPALIRKVRPTSLNLSPLALVMSAAADKPAYVLAQAASNTPDSKGGPAASPSKADRSAGKSQESIKIFWSGELLVKPIEQIENPDSRNYTIVAKGKRILWTSPKQAAVCEIFRLNQPQGSAKLTGSAEMPVRLVTDDGGRVVCRSVDYTPVTGPPENPKPGSLLCQGPGRLLQVDSDSQPRDLERVLALDEQGQTPKSGRQSWISWNGKLVAKLGEEKEAPDKTRQFIADATFNDDVELVQADSGDFVRCEKTLHIIMARVPGALGEDPRSYPLKATATGNVHARQEGSEIDADLLEVEFEEKDEPVVEGKKAAAGSMKSAGLEKKLRAVSIHALGNVKAILDESDDENGAGEKEKRPPLKIIADELDSDLRIRGARTTTIKGLKSKPAQIMQGENFLEGHKIVLDEGEELDEDDNSIDVKGAGKLRFLSKSDADGKALDKPRIVNVNWLERMNFDGKKDQAIFDGDVNLDSGDDSMTCQKMTIKFMEKAAAEPAASAPATKDGGKDESSRPRFDLTSYNRGMAEVICEKKVELTRVRTDDKGRLLERMRMNADNLTYDLSDPENKEVRVKGPGAMFASSYEKPKDKREWPTQTLFKWKRRMRYSLGTREVLLDGDVWMSHRSGVKIVLADGLNTPPIGKLTTGRAVLLDCERLRAIFAEPVSKKTGKSPEGNTATVSIGRLKNLYASGGFVLRDPPQRVVGERLTYYYRDKGVFVVHGSRKIPAEVIYQDGAGVHKTASTPGKITCVLNDKNQVIDAKVDNIAGGG